MENLIGLLLLIIVVLLLAPWILFFLLRSRVKGIEQDFQKRFEHVFDQIDLLSRRLSASEKKVSESAATTEKASIPEAEFRAPAPKPEPAYTAPKEIPRPPVPAREPPPVPVIPAPVATPEQETPTLFERIKGGLNLEEALGTNWLNKLGIIILVFGIAFFLAYQLQNLGAAGKVLVGYVVSLGMMGGGVWLERRDRYRIFARGGIGGGWALTFFTTFAMYHVQAAKVLQSQTIDLVLMLIVAALMVAHTLRYRSQVVTGLAFLLAFSTVTISHVTLYSLTAGAILAVSLVFIVVRMRWYELEVFGILAAFLNHGIWLRTIIEPMGIHKHAFPEFLSSAALLIFYWVVFRVSYVVRDVETERQEQVSTVAALLNSILALALLKYQSVHPEWAFWALLSIGIVELGFAHVPKLRNRRIAFAILATIGTVLLVAAIPFRFSGANVEVLWLALAEAMLFAGIFAREQIFRRLSFAACVATAGHMLGVNAARIYGIRIDDAIVRGHYGLALVFAAAVTLFYVNAYWVHARWPEFFGDWFERRMQTYLSVLAAILGVVGLWIAFPQSQTIMGWGMFALALAYVGEKTNTRDISIEACAIFTIAVMRAFAFNLTEPAHWGFVSQRLITVSILLATLYLGSRWARLPWFWEGSVREVFRWAASVLGAYLLWYELRPVSVAVAWAIFAVILLEFGIAFNSLHLRLQAYVGLGATFLRLFFVNLNASGELGALSPRVYTTLPVVLLFFYAYWRMTEADSESLELDIKWRLPSVSAYFGTMAFAGLIRFELDGDWVAPAWVILVLLLMGVAWTSGRKTFVHQGMLVALAALFRASMHNLYQRSELPGSLWHNPWMTVGITAILLFAALLPAFKLRDLNVAQSGEAWQRYLRTAVRRPDQVLFFMALVLVTILLWVKMPSGMLTVSWGLLGLIVFLFALWVKERSYRWAGLVLLLLCVGKIVLVDVWGLNARDRYLTFIVLGSALLLVSFLYSRHREAIRQYL